MKMKRLAALELLAGLRSLDGTNVNGQFTPFNFDPEVVDKIVENIVALRTFGETVDAYRIELGKLLKIEAGMPATDPVVAQFNAKWIEWINGEVEIDLLPITKTELKLKENRLPISARERLIPLLQA